MNDFLAASRHPISPAQDIADPGATLDSERGNELAPEPEAGSELKKPFVRWRKLLTLAAVYVTTETVLDLAGLDTLASYSEFLQNGQSALQIVGDTIVNLAHLIS